MEFSVERIGDITIVDLPGDMLDASNSAELKQDVASVIETNTQVVFDMSHLRFVDSSGCGALLSCLRKINAKGGDLKLCGVTKPVRVLFEAIRMHRIFEIFNTKEEAIKAFQI